jgi:hypothetical protein
MAPHSPVRAKTARKGVPKSAKPAHCKAKRGLGASLPGGETVSNAMTGSNKKRKRSAKETDSPEAQGAGSVARSASPRAEMGSLLKAAKKRKVEPSAEQGEKSKAAPKTKGKAKIMDTGSDVDRYDDDILLYVPTQKPKADLICKTPQGSLFKISDTVVLGPARILEGEGMATNYNLSQMSWHWIKKFLPKLKDVIQHKVSHRGWKRTLLYSLGEANRTDDGDLALEKQIADLEKQQKKGALAKDEGEVRSSQLREELDNWEPRWSSEPLYEMKIIRGMFDNSRIIVLRLTSTHGNLFVRTYSDFEPWMKFIDWLEVKQSNMRGYRLRRGGDWNGFEVAERPVAEVLDLVSQVAAMNAVFEEQNCVAVWKTIPQFDEQLSDLVSDGTIGERGHAVKSIGK